MLEIIIVAGARPNFVKIAPLIHILLKQDHISYTLVHTGQHYDPLMNDVFFEDLLIPKPDIHLGVEAGTQTQQTADIMVRFENVLKNHRASFILVTGDVTSTLACAIVAKKYHKVLVHIEAGLRSYDRKMPEEINRILTDSISDYFFTTSKEAGQNLLKEGIQEERIFFVGNLMIDSLLQQIRFMQKPAAYNMLSLTEKTYYLLTLHRAENVDDADQLSDVLRTISKSIGNSTCVFPVHPRTEKILRNSALLGAIRNIEFVAPMRYLEFLYLQKHAKGIITDSGGIQEETTYLNIPCITYRTTTERPETITTGSNELAPDLATLSSLIQTIEMDAWKKSSVPDLWDGETAQRIVRTLMELQSL